MFQTYLGQTQELTYCCTSFLLPIYKEHCGCILHTTCNFCSNTCADRMAEGPFGMTSNTKEFHLVPTSVLHISTNCNLADQATHSENTQSFCTPKKRNETASLYFQLASICFLCSAVNNHPAPGWRQRRQGRHIRLKKCMCVEVKNRKISNPKIKYRLLLVPITAFRNSNKHRLLTRKSAVYVIYKILRLLPKCSKDYKWPPRK